MRCAIGCLALASLVAVACAADPAADKPKPSKAVLPAALPKGQKQLATAGEWPQWRGPRRDGISTETGLLTSWPAEGPPIAWQAKGLGSGFSSVAVAGGKVFTAGRRGDAEYLIALDVADGHELWAARIGDSDHTNSTPTVDGDLVFVVGHKGDLLCAQTADGKEVWRKNYERDFGGKMMSSWGFSESPLIDGDRVICTPGSNGAVMAALDKRTGTTVWTAKLPDNVGDRGNEGAAYSSIVVSEAAGTRQYVQLVGKGVIGVAAADGKLLWGYNRIANGTANIPTPIVDGNYVFCSTGYGTGAALLKLSGGRGKITAEEVYFLDADKMQNHHGGMILRNGYIYCGRGHNQGFPLCLEMKSGKAAWQPGRGEGEGSAAIAYADGHIYLRYQDATMALVEATPKAYRVKGTFKIASQHGESWPHPVIAGGRLYLRDQDELHCYDIQKK